MIGHIHSIETCGTVDGPGMRFVVFFKGCPMRCAYCHNPDTWDPNGGEDHTVDDLLHSFNTLKDFYKNGGITATGGEPLLQIDFLLELFTAFHNNGIHTCLDTSGIIYNENNPMLMEKFKKLCEVTDLVMLDIKHINPEKHMDLCKQPNDQILKFAQFLSDQDVDIWIRHVIVPGITYIPEDLRDLGYFIGGLKSLRALDVLPYHTMGEVKYEELGIEYPLKGVEPLTNEDAIKAKSYIIEGIKKRRT